MSQNQQDNQSAHSPLLAGVRFGPQQPTRIVRCEETCRDIRARDWVIVHDEEGQERPAEVVFGPQDVVAMLTATPPEPTGVIVRQIEGPENNGDAVTLPEGAMEWIAADCPNRLAANGSPVLQWSLARVLHLADAASPSRPPELPNLGSPIATPAGQGYLEGIDSRGRWLNVRLETGENVAIDRQSGEIIEPQVKRKKR